MSYARRQAFGSNRLIAIATVAIVHAALGYAIVTGLAYTVIQKATDDLKTFDVKEEPPPPPEEPPPPPPPEKAPETPIVAPPPIVRTNPTPPPVLQTVPTPPPVIASPAPPAPVVRPAPPPPPPPPPVKTVPPKSAVGSLQGLFTGDDYPQSAIELDEEGSVTVKLTVGTNGRVNNCNVLSSSGSSRLDKATCRVLQSRARFTPARDGRGNPTTDSVRQQIRWVLEG